MCQQCCGQVLDVLLVPQLFGRQAASTPINHLQFVLMHRCGTGHATANPVAGGDSSGPRHGLRAHRLQLPCSRPVAVAGTATGGLAGRLGVWLSCAVFVTQSIMSCVTAGPLTAALLVTITGHRRRCRRAATVCSRRSSPWKRPARHRCRCVGWRQVLVGGVAKCRRPAVPTCLEVILAHIASSPFCTVSTCRLSSWQTPTATRCATASGLPTPGSASCMHARSGSHACNRKRCASHSHRPRPLHAPVHLDLSCHAPLPMLFPMLFPSLSDLLCG